jgi:hypothetical protein
MKLKLSRRTILQGAAAAGGSAFLLGEQGLLPRAFGQGAAEPAVLLIYLRGGYNALFSSADSFAPAGTFGVTGTNTRDLGNSLVVDNATFGTNLPAAALTRIAAVGVNHGSSSHETASDMQWNNGGRSYALQLASNMGGTAPIRCAVLGGEFPPGPRAAEGAVSMQQITNLSSTIAALGGGPANPDEPLRGPAAAAVQASRDMSRPILERNSNSLRTAGESFQSTMNLLTAPVKTFNYNDLTTAYGVAATQTAVNNFNMKMLGAELMIAAGARVVIASDGGWDTHGDTTGNNVRNMMNTRILPGLRTFLTRMLADPARSTTVAIFGDFARSLPGSDHARCTSATLIGSRVRVGTTGKVNANVGLPTGSPNVAQFWALLSAAAGVPGTPFGANPHTSLLL